MALRSRDLAALAQAGKAQADAAAAQRWQAEEEAVRLRQALQRGLPHMRALHQRIGEKAAEYGVPQ